LGDERLTLAATMVWSSQPTFLTILMRTNIRKATTIRASEVLTMVTASKIGPRSTSPSSGSVSCGDISKAAIAFLPQRVKARLELETGRLCRAGGSRLHLISTVATLRKVSD